MTSLDSLETLLEDALKDLYSAEKQLLRALPKMAKAASSAALRKAFEMHTEETNQHVKRLEEIASVADMKLNGKRCKAMEGLLEEGKEAMAASGDESLVDIALISAAQKVEHYEIAGYGTAKALAECLGMEDVVSLLDETLSEEYAADEKLTAITSETLANGGDYEQASHASQA